MKRLAYELSPAVWRKSSLENFFGQGSLTIRELTIDSISYYYRGARWYKPVINSVEHTVKLPVADAREVIGHIEYDGMKISPLYAYRGRGRRYVEFVEHTESDTAGDPQFFIALSLNGKTVRRTAWSEDEILNVSFQALLHEPVGAKRKRRVDANSAPQYRVL